MKTHVHRWRLVPAGEWDDHAGHFVCATCGADKADMQAQCVNCGTDFTCRGIIQLCDQCRKLYDIPRLKKQIEYAQVSTVQFNESAKVRARFRLEPRHV